MPRLSIVARLLPFATTSLLLACATGEGPFGTGTSDRDPESHLVRFEVSCGQCAINWEVGGRMGRTDDRGTWSRSVRVRATQENPVVARLVATPLAGSRPVSWIRIRVDGDVIVEASTEGLAGVDAMASRRPLQVRTRVPPPVRSGAIADGGSL